MVKEFGDSIDDSSEGSLGRYEGVVPQMLQAEMLEMIVVTMVLMRRILRNRQMGLKP